jgi:hypothetical protein
LDGVHRSIQCCTWRRRPWSSFYLAGRLRPNDEHRSLAQVLPRIADRTSSELAGLWHEGSAGAQFDATIEHLRSRLEAASKARASWPMGASDFTDVAFFIRRLGSAFSAVIVVTAS